MASIQEFRCEICGLVTSNPTHWFVIRCGDSELTVHRWNSEAANAAGAPTTTAKLMPRCISAAGSSRSVRRPSPTSSSAPKMLSRMEAGK